MSSALSALFDDLKDIVAQRTELYQHLHRNPELSMQEHDTANTIDKELSDLGLETQRIGGTGVVAVITNGPGPTVLARADIDGLPVTENTGLDYTSEREGVMHACGHDMHMATLFGAIDVLLQHRDAWSGTYIALFQPGEEKAAGAKAMVEDGLVDKIPTPDVCFGQHVMVFEAGHIGVVAGPVMSAADSVKITVHGRGAHGSLPQNSIDPVVIAATIVLRLQTLVSREISPSDFGVVTVGALNAGSSANIIPDKAELRLNLRTYDSAVRDKLVAGIDRIVQAECEAAGVEKEPEIEYYDQFPLTTNDESLTERVAEAFEQVFEDGQVFRSARVPASEDFNIIPDAFGVPYHYWQLGGTDPKLFRSSLENGTLVENIPVNHSPGFAPVIDPTLEAGIKAHLAAALTYLGQDQAPQS
ncbi:MULTISPECIES: amidohydrolase [Auritidibacter]|uniref:Amidohydrolase n=1 Tax=Auritidibacter ignavus TaxID=678932 RepID=A0AAJ6DD49_9MICC|nr:MULTISPECIES: amidohydrolase [Auritidibacter]AXR73991.1 amidohydrolase [Auritidibacter sp. NML130574]PXA75966.1 amidohydrolase [Auritidibacter sp. NML100628]WGH84902.1 amidohydrolase [Auritidibacter ignavus]WGH94350.1 amidohydrolase [Auritidibacter ignavus]